MGLLWVYFGSILHHIENPGQKLVSMSNDLQYDAPIPCRWITFALNQIEINDIVFEQEDLEEIRNTLSVCTAHAGDRVYHRSHNNIFFLVLSVNLQANTSHCQLILEDENEGPVYTFSRYEIDQAPVLPLPENLKDPL